MHDDLRELAQHLATLREMIGGRPREIVTRCQTIVSQLRQELHAGETTGDLRTMRQEQERRTKYPVNSE